MTAVQELVQGFSGEQERLLVEIRELDLLIESTKTEVDRLKAREEQARARLDEEKQKLDERLKALLSARGILGLPRTGLR